jgi:hypothetical protein
MKVIWVSTDDFKGLNFFPKKMAIFEKYPFGFLRKEVKYGSDP